MKKVLRFAYVLIASICLSVMVKGQSNKQQAYTVTDSVQNGVKWNYLRKIDLRTGAFSGILLRLLNSNDTVANSPLFNGVAAIALDEKNRRLYYTPMLTDRLMYVDLRTMRIHLVTNNFSGLVPKAPDQGNIFTRLVIGDDNKGYALTNDGKNLVQFNTNNHHIRNLGSLVNAPQNTVSVHEVCNSYGGDIIAADNNLIYLVTSRNHVFKIKIGTKVATYLGTITGLSQNFTTSGTAVDYRNNRVVVGSAIDGSDIYTVDFKTLVAVRLHSPNPWHSSDLANSNMLKKVKDDDDENEEEDRNIFVSAGETDDNLIQLYPNPVTTNEFKIKFRDIPAANYTINVISITGQLVLTEKIDKLSSGKGNIFTINMPALTAKGIYIVRVFDRNNNMLFSEKIVLL